MQNLTPTGEALVSDISSRYNLSRDAVIHMLVAVNNGGGSMAQFNCPELGGSGQWMRGGMTMVGDMFNHGLKSTVDNLCFELATALAESQIFPAIPAGSPDSSQWWPVDLGSPLSSGAQNNTRYAVFAGKLAIQRNGQTTVYDTLTHNIGGVSQQQGSNTSLTFSSQFGTISVDQLPILSEAGMTVSEEIHHEITDQVFTNQAYTANQASTGQIENQGLTPEPDQSHAHWNNSDSNTASSNEIINLIEKLARLRDSGAITDDDFDAKKKELLARL